MLGLDKKSVSVMLSSSYEIKAHKQNRIRMVAGFAFLAKSES